MKNPTLSIDENPDSETPIHAAKAGLSTSRYLAREADNLITKYESQHKAAKRNRQREALECIFAGPKWDVTENGRMPTADERNARG